jgi:hypothetical protein
MRLPGREAGNCYDSETDWLQLSTMLKSHDCTFMSTHLVLTNCTSRKRLGAPVATLPVGVNYDQIQSVADAWQTIYSSAPKLRVIRDLYLGRSFSDAYKASRSADAELLVVSAGLGVVHELDDAPSYDLTLADRTNPLALTLATHGWSAMEWWRALNSTGVGHGPIAHLVRQRPAGLVLIALPSGYLDMVVPDLNDLDAAARDRLRIFSSTAGIAGLPVDLRRFALPYDERLETLAGHSGTRTDFPQRAMRHFVEELGGHHLDLESAKARVSEALRGLVSRQIPSRKKLSDSEIAAELRRQWGRHKGSSTLLLRYLRQEAQIACEQKRFRNIWQGLRAEYANRGTRA